MRIDVHVHDDTADPETLARIEHKLDLILRTEIHMAVDLTSITEATAANTDAVASAVSLLSTLADEIRNSADDPAAVQALADQIQSNADTLGAAITANTV